MTSKAKETTAAAKTEARADDRTAGKAAASSEPKRDVSGQATDCVVDDGTAHMGRAVNGKVCSAHAMHYRADGTRRGH